MAGVIDLLRHPGEFLPARTQLKGPTLLSPCDPEVLYGLGRGLGQPAGQAVEKSSQHLGARDDPPGGLAKGYGDLFQFAGKVGGLLGEIQAKTKNGEGQASGAGDGLDQQSGQFLIFPKKIVGPLENSFEIGQGPDRVRSREGSENGQQGKVVGIRFQEDGAPKAEGTIRNPDVSLATTAGGLDFGRPDGGDLLGFPRQILGGAGLREDMNPTPKEVVGRKQGIDEGGFEGVGDRDPRSFGLRGRNCRKS